MRMRNDAAPQRLVTTRTVLYSGFIFVAWIFCLTLPTRTTAFAPLAPRPNTGQSSSLQASTTDTTPSDRRSSSSGGASNDRKVLFQKVVRPPPNANSMNEPWITTLIGYLQDDFTLPTNLPMVYQLVPESNNDDVENHSRWVLEWDSPLSPDPTATRLSVQVVGIQTTDDDDTDASAASSSSPLDFSMAMVVLSKNKDCNSSKNKNSKVPAMLEGLFADSERRIKDALDRGLQDFILEGPSARSSFSPTAQKQKTNDPWEALADEVQANLVQEDDLPPEQREDRAALKSSTKKPAAFVDAQVVPNVEPRSSSIPRQQATTTRATPPPSSTADFAVQAAQKAVEAQQRKGVQDYAVQAAKLAAQLRQQAAKIKSKVAAKAALKSETTGANKSDDASPLETAASTNMSDDAPPRKMQRDNTSARAVPLAEENNGEPEPISLAAQSQRPPILDHDESPRAFRQTFSRPEDYQPNRQTQNKRKSSAQHSSAKPISVEATPVETVPPPKTTTAAKTESTKPPVIEDAITESVPPKNPVSQSKEIQSPDPASLVEPFAEALDSPPPIDKTKLDPADREMLEATETALQEIEDQSPDISPEELLQDVLQFDKKVENEGFARGALDKAKELLLERDDQRQVKDTDRVRVKELTPDEELRRMFEAGERIAEGRITTTSSTDDTESTTGDDERIDSLIAQDKSVSKHARVLDDELVELEARINPTPGEEFDGPRKSQSIFDVFSGPEVYDPNVDPETAVNWPGAMPGTRNIRLPKELDEAVSQAKFAAQVLMKLYRHQSSGETTPLVVGGREVTPQQIEDLMSVVEEAVEIGLIDDPIELMEEASRLQMLLDEIWTQPDERVREITSNYKDLLLSENFVDLVKDRLEKMADRDLDALRQDDDSLEEPHRREREILGQIVVFAQLLLKETRALGAELETQQLEVIRSICKVAMDPAHQTEEETSLALTDAVRDMRPLLDDGFVAYLKYAVAEEEGRLARAGLLDDPEHNQWLFVLKIVQQGVYAELAKSINRYLEHVWYILRMETPEERRLLLKKLVDVMPTLDVRPFVQVVQNIVGSLGDGVKGDFDGVVPLGEMTNKLLQLHRDMKELLPPERIAIMSRDADEWAAARKKRLLEQRGITKQRLEAARQTEHLEEEISSFGRRGEVDRFD